MPENIMFYFFAVFCLFLIAVYAFRFFRNVCSPVRTVKATVVHKQTVESFSKYAGNGTHTKYAVTFLAGNKKLSFFVSEFSYKGYRINESGTLKYKGTKLIDFH